VVAVESQRLKLRTPAKMIGHVHKSELCDDPKSKKSDLRSYHVGQIVSARVIGKKDLLPNKQKGRRVLTKKIVVKPPLYHFSMKHSILTATDVAALQQLLRARQPALVKPVVEIKKEDDVELAEFSQIARDSLALRLAGSKPISLDRKRSVSYFSAFHHIPSTVFSLSFAKLISEVWLF
jgi:hypothetical protein